MLRRELITLLGGSIAAWPLLARAQQPMPLIGWLSGGSLETDNIPERLVAFWQGLNEAGYIEGQNVAIEYRGAEGQYDRLPALAADLVRRQPSVIVAVVGSPTTFAAKAVTSTIPIVFNQGLDPVQSGLVTSLNRPGGNITGVLNLTAELMPKRLELLHDLVPRATVVALLVNPSNPVTEPETRSLQNAARALELQAHVLPVSTASEIDAAFATLAVLRADVLVVSGDPLFTNQRAQMVGLAARHAVPAVYAWPLFPATGGLMSYGANIADSYHLTGIYVAKILKGASPADLPVEQAVKLDLVINLKTAKSLGLTVPPYILARADEVIE